jgi:hypothetical protein
VRDGPSPATARTASGKIDAMSAARPKMNLIVARGCWWHGPSAETRVGKSSSVLRRRLTWHAMFHGGMLSGSSARYSGSRSILSRQTRRSQLSKEKQVFTDCGKATGVWCILWIEVDDACLSRR